MPVPSFGGLPPYPTFEDVTQKVNRLVNELRMLLMNLDTLNVVSLNAKVIESETITGDKIAANTISADKMNVNELSAISANLGHITAGLIEAVQIFGSYIATSENSFPRIELSSANNLLRASYNGNTYIEISPNESGVPVYKIVDSGVDVFRINYDDDNTENRIQSNSQLTIGSIGGMEIKNDIGNIELSASSVIVPFSILRSSAAGDSLANQLQDIWDAIDDLEDRVSDLEGP